MRDGLSFSRSWITISLKFAACCSLLLLPSMLFAQERGKVEVVKDPKVDSLVQDYLVDKKTGPLANVPAGGNGNIAVSTDGYRVQIYSGAQRQAAYDAQAKFQERFPNQRTYISYSEPYFKVHVGDFRTRLEAEKMQNDLKAWFSGMFIVTEKITPKINTE